MSEAKAEGAVTKPPWTVQFQVSYNENGPQARWVQDREPDLLELALFHSALATRLFRIGALFAGLEDQASQQSAAILTPTNGGHPPALTVLEGTKNEATG